MHVFFSDEAHFHLSDCVNKQNMQYLSERNPRELHERPLHLDRVMVWCAISRVGIIGPYFFSRKRSCFNCEFRPLFDNDPGVFLFFVFFVC